jgi:hypothetical protein
MRRGVSVENSSFKLTYALDGVVFFEETKKLSEFQLNGDLEIGLTLSPGFYTLTITAENCCGECEYKMFINVGQPYKLEKIGCGYYEYTDTTNIPDGTVVQFDLLDVQGTQINRWISREFPGHYRVFLLQDGIYFLRVRYYNPQHEVFFETKFVIFEVCRILDCLKGLLRQRFCDNKDCEGIELKHKINDVLYAGLFLIMSMDIQYGSSHGLMTYDVKFHKDILDYQKMFDAIAKICNLSTNSQQKRSCC